MPQHGLVGIARAVDIEDLGLHPTLGAVLEFPCSQWILTGTFWYPVTYPQFRLFPQVLWFFHWVQAMYTSCGTL